MRESLFRGKDIETGEWIEGGVFVSESKTKPEFARAFIVCGMVDFKGIMIEVSPMSVSQFTGLIDKNGNRIFENDVVNVPVRRLSRSNWWQKTNEHHGFVGDFVYKIVKFKVSAAASTFEFYKLPITRKQVEEIAKPRGKERVMQAVDDINFKAKETEIIGNIFDNPDLAAKND